VSVIHKGDPIVELEAVTIARRSQSTMVEDVNWRVESGDFWVVAGGSGAGKSNLLEVASGLARPSAGKLRLFGQPVSYEVEDSVLPERLRIGMVFEDGGRLFQRMTVEENIALPLCYHQNCSHEEVKAQVTRVLELMHLEHYTHFVPASMSRSWRQRVALARALVLQPELLVMDNPLSGLEASHFAWWLDFTGKLARGHPILGGRPVTVVLTSENVRPWLKLATHAAVIEGYTLHVTANDTPEKLTQDERFAPYLQ
jgi:ABC-type transporter Mla maintaining outer membrane lipid asymmetry ATPase subunit MlaF